MTNQAITQMIFSERRAVLLPPEAPAAGHAAGEMGPNKLLAGAALRNMQALGFTLDVQGFEALSYAAPDDIICFTETVLPMLREAIGGNREYRPFYPNFPEEVMELSDFQRFLEQLAHYAFGYKPVHEKDEDLESREVHELKVLTALPDEEEAVHSLAREIFQNRIASKKGISEGYLELVLLPYMRTYPDWTRDAGNATNRGIICFLYAYALVNRLDTAFLPALVTQDAVRIAKMLSHKDEDPENRNGGMIIPYETGDLRIFTLSRPERKAILQILEAQANLEEDVARDIPAFKALFRYTHPHEFRRFPRVRAVADKVYRGEPLETFYGRLERLFESGQIEEAAGLLASRPGEFMKRVNRLLENRIDPEVLADLCETKVFPKCRMEDLLDLHEYLTGRIDPRYLAVHKIPSKTGSSSRFVSSRKTYETLPREAVSGILPLLRQEITKRASRGLTALYTAGPLSEAGEAVPVTRLYVDPLLKDIPLPKDIQDSSISLANWPKGSKLPVEKDESGSPKNLRVFAWWTNLEKQPDNKYESSRLDIDLSAVLYSRDPQNSLTVSQIVSYSHEYSVFGGACVHSGDIVDGNDFEGKGVTEFIDADIGLLRQNGIEYVQFYINAYTGQSFDEIPHLEFGWMERDDLNCSVEHFDIRAVRQHAHPTGTAGSAITCAVLDVTAGCMYWLDVPDLAASAGTNAYLATLQAKSGISAIDILRHRYMSGYRMSMHELASGLTLEGRQVIFVSDPAQADLLFTLEPYAEKKENQTVIKATDGDIWVGRLMADAVEP